MVNTLNCGLFDSTSMKAVASSAAIRLIHTSHIERYINVPISIHHSFKNSDKSETLFIHSMPMESLPLFSEKILSTVWKMNTAGQKAVPEDTVKDELSISNDEFTKWVEMLQKQGFLSRVKVNEKPSLFLTPLGIAILRQIVEDSLEELK